MTIKSKQLFILIGDDRTGKTTLQKLLIEKICNQFYDRLPTNLRFNILHPEIKRKYENISFGNRSYQEKIGDYGMVDEYFKNHFNPADISIISSHLNIGQISEMIRNGKQRFYNVTGIFFSNSIEINQITNSQIALLDWDEKLVVENVITENQQFIDRQLNAIADNFVIFISNRAGVS
jgi:hypothetical protein